MLSTAAQFTRILGQLRTAVALFLARQARGPMVVLLGTQAFVQKLPPSPHRPIPAETWNLLIHRIGAIAQRFQSLVRRWQEGTLRPARARAESAGAERAGGATRPPASRPPYLRLPRETGWINKRVPEAAPCAGMLHALLQQEEWPRFLAEVPRAGRLLRPLCRALGLSLPPALRLPPRPRRPRPKPPATAPVIGTPDRPVPAYVMAAARAWKKRGE